jgi:predicted TIM-barrel fold metal-dependent hydrolase
MPRPPRKSLPEQPERLPVDLGPVSNGEFFPLAPTAPLLAARQRARRDAAEHAHRAGMSRRELLSGACGTATVLLALNQTGCSGGRYAVEPDAAVDPARAAASIGGDELIFDVQTHHVEPTRDWATRNHAFDFLARTEQARCGAERWLDCYSRDHFLRAVFLESDTDVAVLSALAEIPRNNPLTIEEAVRTREQMERAGPGRLQLHGIVLPNGGPLQEQVDGMQALAERHRVAAWKMYPVWGPGGSGYWLDGPQGTAVLDQARKLGVKTVAVHKGITLPGMDSTFSQCRDIGPVARRYPDLTFLVYHAGVEFDVGEGPYDVGRALGLDSLIRSLQENDLRPGSNVYADLGAVWKILMRDPDQAAHLLGKLLKHLGEDRVLWGTDSIWFGSPQDQIQAFRAFEITPELQQKHGYPPLTREVKRKVLGLNAARVYGVDPEKLRQKVRADDLARARAEWRDSGVDRLPALGPRSRREVLALWRDRGGRP